MNKNLTNDARERRVCSVDGCDSQARARGLCSMHYQRARDQGRLEAFALIVDPRDGTANPWAGDRECPRCGADDWTMPYSPDTDVWHCVRCVQQLTIAHGVFAALAHATRTGEVPVLPRSAAWQVVTGTNPREVTLTVRGVQDADARRSAMDHAGVALVNAGYAVLRAGDRCRVVRHYN